MKNSSIFFILQQQGYFSSFIFDKTVNYLLLLSFISRGMIKQHSI